MGLRQCYCAQDRLISTRLQKRAIANLLAGRHPQDLLEQIQDYALKILHSQRHQINLAEESIALARTMREALRLGAVAHGGNSLALASHEWEKTALLHRYASMDAIHSDLTSIPLS
ncbi:MAG: hypothetical protein V7K40_23090 [Nostoc sp.]